jgi:hypothetical protein
MNFFSAGVSCRSGTDGGRGEGEGVDGCSFGGIGSNSIGDGTLADDGIIRPGPLPIFSRNEFPRTNMIDLCTIFLILINMCG